MNNWPLYLHVPYWKGAETDMEQQEYHTGRTIDQLIASSDKADRKVSIDGFYRNRHQIEFSPLLPLGLIMVVCTVVFILIVFRRWPGIVAGVIAGFLTSVSIYLMLLAFREQRLVFE